MVTDLSTPLAFRLRTEEPLGIEVAWNQHDALGGDPVNLSDPTGKFPIILAVVVVGALVGAGGDIAMQVATNAIAGCPLLNINWGSVGVSAAAGIVPGGGAIRGASLAGKAARTTRPVNLASARRTKHILHGDKTGGGHLWPGKPGKSVFPKSWSPEQILEAASDIATDPAAKQIGKKGDRIVLVGVRDGVKIKVVTDGRDIITAYPIK